MSILKQVRDLPAYGILSHKTCAGVFFVGMLARCYTIALSRNKETGL